MKAQEIIDTIRKTDDEHSIRMLESIFKFGYVFGLKKGYINITNAIRHEVPVSDADEANLVWSKHFL